MTENITACPDKEALVTYLYEEDDGPGRRAIEAHVERCAACRDEVSGLRRVRERLAEWEAQELEAPLPAFASPPGQPERRPWITRPAFIAAAAAVLIVGMAAGLANLEIRFDSEGLVIRTGWTRAGAPSPASANAKTPSVASAVPAASSAPIQPADAPWRGDLAALERQLRQEFQPLRAAAAAPASTSAMRGSSPGLDPEALRQIQALLDESEVRQQRNLALRVAEVSRDFDLQRKADLVQIQQGLGRLEGRTDAEAARTRELVNYMMRVSQQQPPR